MENLQNHMQYPTFLSLIAAMEENLTLIQNGRAALKKRKHRMQESLFMMKDSIDRLEEGAPYPADEHDSHVQEENFCPWPRQDIRKTA